MTFIWTPERVDQLKQLCAEKLPYSHIGKILGTATRNAVIGKASRLGITNGRHNINFSPDADQIKHSQDKPLKTKNYSKLSSNPFFISVRNTPPIEFKCDDDISAEQRRTLMQLENHHCRWPCGDPRESDFFFCGHPSADVIDGRPYCAHHSRQSRRAG